MKTETDITETHYLKKINTTLVIAMADGSQSQLDEAPDELLLNLVEVMNGYLQQYDCEIRDVKGENGKYHDTATVAKEVSK
tara:strand:- start:436 stop:678 length:243 start_codon:yes stop_codon:yes gene_type:complete